MLYSGHLNLEAEPFSHFLKILIMFVAWRNFRNAMWTGNTRCEYPTKGLAIFHAAPARGRCGRARSRRDGGAAGPLLPLWAASSSAPTPHRDGGTAGGRPCPHGPLPALPTGTGHGPGSPRGAPAPSSALRPNTFPSAIRGCRREVLNSRWPGLISEKLKARIAGVVFLVFYFPHSKMCTLFWIAL